MKHIVYTEIDGRMAITTPAYQKGVSDEAIEKAAWDKLPPYAADARWVDDAAIHTYRATRTAKTHEELKGARK